MDLKKRLEMDLTRLQEPLEDAGFTYGFSQTYLKTVGEYWLKKFDFAKSEKLLNSMPQFKTSIDGIDLHFVHAKPDPKQAKGKTVLPLLLVHGWPGKWEWLNERMTEMVLIVNAGFLGLDSWG